MRTALIALLYAAALGLGLFITFRPTFESGFAQMQTERGDGMLNHYILEHEWQSISNPDYCGSLFSPPCFAPEPYTLWYSEHLLGVAPVYWALRAVGVPYDFAYQWWQIILVALNFVAFAVIMRWLRCPHIVAVLGGFLWAFALVHQRQLMHQQMIPRFAMAIAVYHAWCFVMALRGTSEAKTEDNTVDPTISSRHLNRMLAAVFFHGITCVNSAWFLVAGLATFLPLAVALRPGAWRGLRVFLRENRWRTAWIVGGWVTALTLAYVPYLYVNWGQGRSYAEAADHGLMPTPSAWFTGPPGSVWEQTTAPYRKSVTNECELFCGFGILAIAVVAGLHATVSLFRRNCPPEFGLIVAGLITSALWVVATMAPYDGGPSLWEYIMYIPGGQAIRCVSRVYVLVYLFGTIASLVWLSRVTETLRPAIRTAVLTALAAWCIVEQMGFGPPHFDKREFYPLADRVAAQLPPGDMGFVVPRYTDSNGEVFVHAYGEVLAMWAGLRANIPVANGYSGRVPSIEHPSVATTSEGIQHPEVRGEVLHKWLDGKFHGTLVIVDPDNPDARHVMTFEPAEK